VLAAVFDMAGLSGHTRTGARAGSPAFLPWREVVNYKYARPEVDVWAAAALQAAPVAIRERLPSCAALSKRPSDVRRPPIDT
jgi:hypothetical protein